MLACVIKPSFWCFWGLLPWELQWSIGIGVAIIVLALSWRLLAWLKGIAGWGGLAGGAVIVLGFLATLFGWFRGGRGTIDWNKVDEMPDDPGGFGFKLPKFGKPTTSGKKRSFNVDTGQWE